MGHVLVLVITFLVCMGIHTWEPGLSSFCEVNDQRHIHLSGAVNPFSCDYSRSLAS
jgi:hypothetical protein